jgi:rhodanese-related sulfurtransferase
MRFGGGMAMVLVLVGLGGCGAPAKTSDKDLQTLDYTQVRDMLAGTKSRTVLVDVRSPAKYRQGHIPGSMNVPVQEIVEQDPRFAEVDNIIVYASGWTDYLSSAAAKKMVALGYQNVHDFRGGLEMWQSYGGRVEGEAADVQH